MLIYDIFGIFGIRYLMSTGGDGHVCFWSWDPKTIEFR